MSDELTRPPTETLRSRESDVEPIPDLSARVLQKGRAARSRRLALGWGATGLVAALAVAAVVLGPLGQPIWVRCDVTSGACEQAPIPTSNGTSAVIDW